MAYLDEGVYTATDKYDPIREKELEEKLERLMREKLVIVGKMDDIIAELKSMWRKDK